MQDMESKLGPWVIKYRWLIILLSFVLVLGAASGGRFLVFKADYRVFFSGDNPQLQAFDKLERHTAKTIMFSLSYHQKMAMFLQTKHSK